MVREPSGLEGGRVGFENSFETGLVLSRSENWRV